MSWQPNERWWRQFASDPSKLPWGILGCVLCTIAVLFLTGEMFMPRLWDSPASRALALKRFAEGDAELAKLLTRYERQAEWRELRDRGLLAQEVQKSLEESTKQLQSEFTRLETTPAGRALTASLTSLETYIAIREAPRPEPSEFEECTATITATLKLCDEMLNRELLSIGPEKRVSRFQFLAQAIGKAEADAKRDLRLLQTLIVSVPPDVSGRDLKQAMEEVRRKRDEPFLAELKLELERIGKLEARVRQQKALHVENARHLADLAHLTGQLAAAGITQKEASWTVLHAIQDMQRVIVRAQELEKFELLLPEIKALLSPIISPGDMQPSNTQGWSYGEKKGPLSARELELAGVFKADDEGWRNLGFLLTGPNCGNDRPRGSFPETVEYHAKEIKRAHALLVEFRDLLLEKKMLQR